MTAIRISGISKTFGDVTALQDIDLEVESGENIAVLGPSGSGKSTLLRVLSGLEQVDTGEILFDGRLQNHIPPEKRDVAIVFQSYALYPHLSCRENITLGLRHGMRLATISGVNGVYTPDDIARIRALALEARAAQATA